MLKPSQPGLRAAAILLSAALLSACGGGGGGVDGGAAPDQPSPPTQPSQPAATELRLTGSSASAIAGGAAVTLNASLNGAGSVSWALAAGNPGTLSATTGTSVSYTPPITFTGATTVTITATSGSLSKNIVLSLAPTAPGLTLLAGTITPGNAILDGVSASARFSQVRALSTDNNGLIYVGDNSYVDGRPLIRKVSADGAVTSLKADWSTLPTPTTINALTVLADGSIYFSDVMTSFVSSSVTRAVSTFRKLGTDGKLTTLGVVDEGSATSWQLRAAADGTLYVANNTAIYLLASDGSRQLLAGGSASQTNADVDGVGGDARFFGIKQLQVAPDGSLLVLDTYALRQVSKAGVVATLLPQDARSGALDLSLDQQGAPLLLYPPAPGTTYQVRKFSGGVLRTLYTLGGSALHSASRLLSMADGSVITAHGVSLSRTVADGNTVTLAGLPDDSGDTTADGQGAQARLIGPGMLAADHDGNIFAVEFAGQMMPNILRKITPAGVVTNFAIGGLQGLITGMTVTPANQLIISTRSISNYGGGLYQIGQDGSYSLIAGGSYYAAPLQQKDGQGNAAVFGRPTLAGVDPDGNLYVSDQLYTDIAIYSFRKITPQGVVSTITSLPAGLGAAADGNVYTINPAGSAVLRVAPDGSRTVVAGVASGGALTNLPGPLPALLFQARSVVPLGGKVFAVAAGNGIYTLVLP